MVTNFIGGAPVQVGIFPVNSPASKLLGAQPLKEEKSVNLSAGFAVTPLDNLTLTADVYDIRIKNRILLTGTFQSAGVQTLLANNGFAGIGGVQYFTNGLDTKTQGIDLTADQRILFKADRTLTLNAAVNYGKNEITRVDDLPAVLANAGETGLLDEATRVAIEKERPDWRGTLTATYAQSAWRGLVRASYYGRFSSEQPALTPGFTEKYPSRTLVDAEAGYKLQQVELAIGARNVFDTYPGKMQLEFNNNDAVFPWAAASPFGFNGRFLYTRATWTLPR